MAVAKQAWQYEFGPFRLDVTDRQLLCDGQPVSLPPKVFDTLVVLIDNSPRLVTKEQLIARLWPNTFVEEATLARYVSDLRKALSAAGGEQTYIETVPRHGYRFAAAVSRGAEGTATMVVEMHTRSRLVSEQDLEDDPAVTGSQEALPNQVRRQAFNPLSLTTAAGLVSVVVLTAALTYFALTRSTPTGGRVTVRSIAVLPFRYVDGDENDRYVGIGMADALITRLSKIRQIRVRPTNAITKYESADRDALAAGRELGVDAVLEGRIQRFGDRLRLSVQLITLEGNCTTLWAGTFDSNSTDAFAMQDSISEQVVRALSLELTSDEEKRLAKRYTDNSEAYQTYMKGRFWWNKRSPEGFRRAIEFFDQAIALDRNYALPYAGLADCYTLMSPYAVVGPKEAYPRARAAATQALALDNQLAEAHASLAHITWIYDWDFPAAEAEFKTAIELDPNYATAHEWYSVYLSSMGRHDEAIARVMRAREIDPVSIPIITDLARAYYHARRYDEAIDAYRQTLDLNPNNYRLNSWLELAYAQKGKYDQAIESRIKSMSLISFNPEKLTSLKEAYAKSGWAGYWRKEIEFAPAKPATNYYYVARAYARLGDKEQALAWLKKAYEEKVDHLILLKVDPIFDPLRNDPRFTELLRNIGFLV